MHTGRAVVLFDASSTKGQISDVVSEVQDRSRRSDSNRKGASSATADRRSERLAEGHVRAVVAGRPDALLRATERPRSGHVVAAMLEMNKLVSAVRQEAYDNA